MSSPAPPTTNPITSVRQLRAAVLSGSRRPPTSAQLAQIRDAAKTLKADQLPWVKNFLAARTAS